MIFTQLVAAALSMGFEQVIQTRYGGVGVLSLLLIGAGIKSNNTTCSSIGAVLLVLLMTQA
ncbi:hypothetical protein ACFY0F_10145 [Streptomyces sp. NPDC001544]|uniref:hypothetical protein n=1 Tax=Streptomyces sp. NPDC001544 TaxID=3364584 RepID=UPI0036AF8ED9